MKLINTDGMAFIGPGSEWFWTALSGIILAVTCGFFENLSDLEEEGYLTWKEVLSTWGEPLVGYWALLAPTIREVQASTPTVFTGFERLARRAEEEARRRGDDWSVPESQLPEYIETQIGRNTARLRMLRDIAAGVIPTGTGSVSGATRRSTARTSSRSSWDSVAASREGAIGWANTMEAWCPRPSLPP